MNYDRGFQTFVTVPGQEGSATRLLENYHHESRDVRAAWRLESDLNAPQTIIKAMEWLERIGIKVVEVDVPTIVRPRNSGSIHCAAGSLIRDPEPKD